MQSKILQAAALLVMTASVIVAAATHSSALHEKCKQEWEIVPQEKTRQDSTTEKIQDNTLFTTDIIGYHFS
jgi:hypothetical protein